MILWLIMHGALLALFVLQGEPLRLHEDWAEVGTLTLVGMLISQLFGNALAEEIVFRGFLLSQLYIKFRGDRTSARGGALVKALILSQAIFSLMHLPIRLYNDIEGAALVFDLLRTFVFGVFFALIYLRTRNLFVVVGVHALANRPTAVLGALAPPGLMVMVLGVLLLLVWPWMARWWARRARVGYAP